MLDILRRVPTPNGGSAKRRKGEATKPTDEETAVKVLIKSVSLLMNEQRATAARVGVTLLLPGEHPLTQALESTKQVYAEHQPVKEVGKAGTPPPWGAPRNVFTATMFEVTIVMYKATQTLEDDAVQIWGAPHIKLIVDNLYQVVNDAKKNQEFTILDPLCTFFRFRLAKSGQGIVEITGGTGKVFATNLRKYNLFALPLEDLWGILLMPYAQYMTSGSAPKGRLERLLAKHLPNNK